MTDEEMRAEVQDLRDRREIYACLTRYCRGQDRLDAELTRSAFHLDAVLDFGAFVGTLDEFVPWGHKYHASFQNTSMHCLCNHSCEIDGDTAHCETYFIYVDDSKDGTHAQRAGRYIDTFEKRNGRWAIAERLCMIDVGDINLGQDVIDALDPNLLIKATRGDRTDPSYARPFKIDRERFRAAPAIAPNK
jgi:SnoaL-like domain